MSAPETMLVPSLEALLSRALEQSSFDSVARAAAAVAEGDVTADVFFLFESCFRAMGGHWGEEVRRLRGMRDALGDGSGSGGRGRGENVGVNVQVNVEVKPEAEEVALATAGEGGGGSGAADERTDALVAEGAKIENGLQARHASVVVSAGTSRSGGGVVKDESVVVGSGERAVDDGNAVGVAVKVEGAVRSGASGIHLPGSSKRGDKAAASSRGSGNRGSAIGSVCVDLPPPTEKGSNRGAATGLSVPVYRGNGNAVGKTASELDEGAVHGGARTVGTIASRPHSCAAVNGDPATGISFCESDDRNTGRSGSGPVSAPMHGSKSGASGSGGVKRKMKVEAELDPFSKRRKRTNGASPSAPSVQLQPVEEAGPLANPATEGTPCPREAHTIVYRDQGADAPDPASDTIAEPEDALDLGVDYEQLLAHLLEHAFDKSVNPSLASDPRFTHFFRVAELIHRETKPVYQEEPSGAVSCTIILHLSSDMNNASFFVPRFPVQTVGKAINPLMARQKAAKLCIDELSRRLENIAMSCHAGVANRLRDLVENVWKVEQSDERRNAACLTAQQLVNHNFFGCTARTFGSFSSGTSHTFSGLDIEIVLVQPDAQMAALRPFRSSHRNILSFLGRSFSTAGMKDVQITPRQSRSTHCSSQPPCLHYFDVANQLRVDVVIATSTKPVLLSRLLRMHMSSDPRVWEVTMMVKNWAYHRNLSRPRSSFVPAVGWAVMVVYFLRQPTPAIGSFFKVNQKCLDSPRHARDVRIRRVAWTSSAKHGSNNSSAAYLVTQFFAFYAAFDFITTAIQLDQQRVVLRSEFKTRAHRTCAMLVTNPIDSQNGEATNITRLVDSQSLKKTVEELRRAQFICENTGDLRKACEDVKHRF